MSRLLFITSNRIGDAVLSTAMLERALALAPGAAVTIACGPLPAPLFRATPGLERLLTIEKQQGRWFRLWRALAGRRYRLAIDLRGSLITFALPCGRRIVHAKSRRLQHKLEELAALLGDSAALEPRLHLDAAARADAEAAAAADGGPILVLGAGANFIGKRWPPERFAETARALMRGKLAAARLVLLGAPSDAAVNAEIAASLNGASVLDLTGKLDLLACAALLERAALFVGNDSGLMHIAAAMGAPTLGLFGPSDERVYGPAGPRTRAIRGPRSFEEVISIGYMPLIEHSLMEELAVSDVIAAAEGLLT